MITARARTAALVLAVALPLAACGGSSEGDAEAAGPSASGQFPRTVEHAMGTTEIPAEPERIVVLDTGELDSAVALGITPVGAVTTDVAAGFLSYLEGPAEGVQKVGTISEPDLEAIAAARPDLILSNKVRHDALYDQLSQIAPTVFAEEVGAVWKDNFRLTGEALGMEDEVERVLADYEAEAAELGGSVGDRVVSPVRFVEGTIRIYQPESFIGTVMDDIGAAMVEVPGAEYPQFAELSQEELTLADADIVLYSSYGESADSGEDTVTGGPLWSRLSAVQEGGAVAVEDDVFFTGIGPTAAALIVERLAGALD